MDERDTVKRGHRHQRGFALRSARRSIPGQIYAVTTVTGERERLFTDLGCARALVKELAAADAHGCSLTFAYVVMPDHLHWLFKLLDKDLSGLVRRTKSRSAIAINTLMDTPGKKIWQKGFYDHALRTEEGILDVAEYIVENPCRAGLVKSIYEYSHWDIQFKA
ncbi:MAG: transposase [Thermodesulfobacteriota bacterium]|nr:transposase [Thermodesulfobacteriota bacterium]